MKKFVVTDIKNFPGYCLLSLAQVKKADFEFEAGQYASISFKRGAQWSPARSFSIVSASQDLGTLQFAFRVSGDFTERLSELHIGDKLRVQGPFGNFVLDQDKMYDEPMTIMLAAGIGITPFVSMLRSLPDSVQTQKMTLLYACRSRNDIPFADELRNLADQYPNVRVLFVIASEAQNNTELLYYAGRINEGLLRRAVGGDFLGANYYLCGPDRFMEDMQAILSDNDVPESQIITESFKQIDATGLPTKRVNVNTLTYALTAITLTVGIMGIMGLDLIRYIPKVRAETTNNTAQTQSTSTSTPTSSSNSSNTSSSSNTSPSSSTSSSTSTPSTSAYNTYSAPTTQSSASSNSQVS